MPAPVSKAFCVIAAIQIDGFFKLLQLGVNKNLMPTSASGLLKDQANVKRIMHKNIGTRMIFAFSTHFRPPKMQTVTKPSTTKWHKTGQAGVPTKVSKLFKLVTSSCGNPIQVMKK
ncbi:hypothetical protein Ciccas_012362 [Cichlidogyrus casuarinus]|uniref:Uncharacterized protein n=1 Tax=Cichlidogyrus casuarinus TaxID=1844966 RepID=A0ABD2PNL0_9PLAT